MADIQIGQGGESHAKLSPDTPYFLDQAILAHLTRTARNPGDVAPLLMPTAEEEQAHREAIAERVALLVDRFVIHICLEKLSKDMRLVAQAGRKLFELRSSFIGPSDCPVAMNEQLGLLTKSMYQTIQEIQKPDWLEVPPAGRTEVWVEWSDPDQKRCRIAVWQNEPYRYFALSASACEEILNTTVNTILECDRQRWLSDAAKLAETVVLENGVWDDVAFRGVVSAKKLSPKLCPDHELIKLIFGRDEKYIRTLYGEDVDPRQNVPTREVPTSLVPFLAEKLREYKLSVELCVHQMEWMEYNRRNGYSVLSSLRISWPG